MRRVFGSLAIGLLSVSGAAAQQMNPWDIIATETARGAYVCPQLSDEHFFCLQLTCAPGEPPEWIVSFTSAAYDERPIRATFLVDNQVGATLDMTRQATPNVFTYTAPYDPRLHSRFVERLQAGSRGEVRLIFEADPTVTRAFTLRGSGAALDHVRGQCEMEAAITVPDPVYHVAERLQGLCREAGEEIGFTDGFFRAEDVDGDGLMDAVIDYGGVDCQRNTFMNCGTGGCTMEVWRAQPEGGFALVWGDTAYAVRTVGGGQFVANTHRGTCGEERGASGNCERRFQLVGNRLTFLGFDQ